MKYDLIVFTSGPEAYAPVRIAEESKLLNKKTAIIAYKDINILFKNGSFELKLNNQKMPESRAILLRGLGEDSVYNPLKTAIIDWYKLKGSNVLNYSSFEKWPSLDKVTQYLNFSLNGLPVVESRFFGRRNDLEKWAENNYPFIAKEAIGSCGINVFKIKNKKDLIGLFDLGYGGIVKIKTLLFQKFLNAGEDIRVIILGGKILGAMKRIAKKGEYLTNYSRGGDVVYYDIQADKEASEIACKVAKTFKLDFCGVDLMKDNNGKWVVLEVNRACQFEGFEKVNRVNVASETIKYLT